MNYLYICRFKEYENFIKIGITNDISIRINQHQVVWGELLDDSIYYEIILRDDALNLELILKKMLKHFKDDCNIIPKNDGYTEFVPITHFEYIKNFLHQGYISIETGTVVSLVQKDMIKLPILQKKLNKILPLSDLIRCLRLQQEITQKQLATRAKVSLTSVKNIEQGKNITVDNLMSMIYTLGYTDWLYTLSEKIELRKLFLGTKKGLRQRAKVLRPKKV
jgi:DNA-binding XRE family transcriptional regulator/predicted GIY-YIG superfamily endonuclease